MNKLITLIMSLFTLTAISATDPKTAYSMVQDNKAVIIDVREEDEIKSGMIKDAIWFPMSKVLNDKDWKEDFNKIVDRKKIFLHCRTGRRSGKVMKVLKKNGIESENLGGYEDLRKILPVTEKE